MKILHIHPSLEGGGIEAMICGLANEMVKTEDVTVCSIFEPKETDVFYRQLAPGVRRITCHKIRQGFSLKELWLVWQIIRQGKYDVVHLHGFLYYYLLAILLSGRSRTRFVYTVHNDAFRENGRWDTHLLGIKKWLFRKGIVRPVTISEISKASFTALYHCESRLVYNGIPRPKTDASKRTDIIEAARRTKDTAVLLNAARIDTQKNQLVLCKVAQRLVEEGEDIVLLLAGSVTNTVSYEEIVPYLSERIMYLGERNDIPQLLSEVDAFCLPSRWEGLPVTLLESLAVGCVPICAPVGGIVNVLTDGRDGLLSASCCEEDYYQALKRFLALSSEERTAMRQEGMKTFSRYEISKTSGEYLAYYRELLDT